MHASGRLAMASLSQALLLGYLLSPHSAFQEHAAHVVEWPTTLNSKGSWGTCIPQGVTTFLLRAFTAHRLTKQRFINALAAEIDERAAFSEGTELLYRTKFRRCYRKAGCPTPCHAGAELVSRSRRVPVVLVVLIVLVLLLLVVAVVLIAELDRPDVTEARPHWGYSPCAAPIDPAQDRWHRFRHQSPGWSPAGGHAHSPAGRYR